MKLKNKLQNWENIVVVVVMGVLWLFSLWKNHLGLECDEAYCIALGDVLAKGNAPFKEIWSCLQMSAIYVAPVIWIYTKIVGSTEGILLTFRILAVLIQAIISIYFYFTFSKRNFDKKLLLVSCILFFLFVPDFQTFLYKTEIIWFSVLEIIYLYRYYITKKTKYLILLGLMISAGVLAYPTAIIQFPVCLFAIYQLNKETMDKKDIVKDLMIVCSVCCGCAGLFLVFVFSRISISDFIIFFPKVFQDDALDSSFFTKLLHPIFKYVAIGVMVILPVMLCTKVRQLKLMIERYHIPIISLLLVFAFLGQCYIERTGITWHCLTYPYTVTVYLLPILYCVSNNKKENCILLWLFELPAVTIALCMALASNQGNMTSMYGSIFSVMGLLLMLGNIQNTDSERIFFQERYFIAGSLLFFSLCMSIPVWDQESVMTEYEAGTIFSTRVEVEYGPARGCAMGIPTYEEYNMLCSVIREAVTNEDSLLIVDNDRIAAYGYMYSNCHYATYSPQGGHKIGIDDTIVEYYKCNPQKQPTVVVINLSYIEQDIDIYMKDSPLGQYLTKHSFKIVEEYEKYNVLRQG